MQQLNALRFLLLFLIYTRTTKAHWPNTLMLPLKLRNQEIAAAGRADQWAIMWRV